MNCSKFISKLPDLLRKSIWTTGKFYWNRYQLTAFWWSVITTWWL